MPSPRTSRTTVLAALVLAALAVSTTAAAAAPGHSTSRSSAHGAGAGRDAGALSFTGRGFGHGHGLSQWGAQGAALKGLSARQILDFYYPTLEQGHAGGTVSVWISADTGSDTVVSPRSGLKAETAGGGHVVRLDTKGVSQWRLTPASNGKRTAIDFKGGGGWKRLRTLPGEAQFDAGGQPITLHVNQTRVAYRGVLRSSPSGSLSSSLSTKKRVTVNVVPLEDYLRGVVPREAISSWKPAALQAQAVAARTYAAYERAHPLTSAYQICDTAACQVYGGASDEVASTDAAVAATRRQVLTDGGSPAFTQFSASNGGWMAAGSQPYLVSKRDPYDHAYRNWHAKVTGAQVSRAFPVIGHFESARILERDGHGQWGGRVLTVRLTGSAGSIVASGDDVRSAFGLMSTWFTLA